MNLVASKTFQCFYTCLNFYNFFSLEKRTLFHLLRDVKVSQENTNSR